MNKLNTYRKTWAEVDLKAITFNFRHIKNKVGQETKVIAAVKANAYGHGLIDVSRHLEKLGVDFLGTSSIDEAVALRKADIKSPILNLSNLLPAETEAVIKFGITPSVIDLKTAAKLNKEAAAFKKKIPVHIKIDTGMGRIGIWHKEAAAFFKKLKSLTNLLIESIYTHFPSAECDKEFTLEQLDKFNTVVEEAKSFGVNPKYLHTANSAGLLNYKETHFNLVRPGLAIYGISPHSEIETALKPALSFKTTVAYIKKISKGRSVSYGRQFVAEKDTRIATLPVGYGDGYSHLFSNKARVLIKGNFYPVAGRICMDQTMVDIGLNDNIKVGDEVVLIGSQKGKQIKTEDLASLCGTIPYQILCWISDRVPRVYR